MADPELERRLSSLIEQLQAAEEVIRLMEDDAVPPAALEAWERYRAKYPRAGE